MLLELNISMSRLARSIHVDSSLVNRWVHGERIPSYNSAYIENIAEYLSKNVHNKFQINNINSVLLKQGLKFDNQDDIYNNIKIALLEAQGYSFQYQKEHLKHKKINSREKNDKLIPKAVLKTDTMKDLLQKEGLQEIVELSSDDKVVFGYDNIIELTIELLNDAISNDFVKNKLIYMTYNNNFPKSKYESMEMKACFSKAINKGWKIIILMRIDNNLCRLLNFNKFAIPLFIQGGLTIYYYTQYGLIGAERETFLIPQIGAISSFANSQNLEINTAFVLKNYSALTVYEEYFNILKMSNYRQLIKYYSSNECMEYCNFLIECEESVGNQMAFKSNLSTIMLTDHIYYKLLKKSDISDHMKKNAFTYFKKQYNSFRNNVKHYEFKEIYFMDSISDLIKNQEFYLYYYTGIKKIKLNVHEIIELMENIINNLKKYANYYISFINKKSVDLLGLNNFSFLLKERKALLFENFDLTDNPSLRISIDEPFSISACYELFSKNWNGIASLFKDKVEIIKYLQRHIDVLKR